MSNPPVFPVDPVLAAPVGSRLVGFLEAQPFILLFLVVAAGYALGRVGIRKLTLGATAATLLVGLALSIACYYGLGVAFELPEFTGTIFFNLFMFAVGMKVGPQFASGLRREGRHLVLLGLFVPLLSAALVFAMRFVWAMPPGLLPGILAGANTATPGIGAAQAALASAGKGADAAGNLSAAFAIGYSLSLALFIVEMKLLPRIFGRDVEADAKAEEARTSGGGAPLPGSSEALVGGAMPVEVRSYELRNEVLVGRPRSELAREFPWVAVERVRRDGVLLEETQVDTYRLGDVLVLSGPIERLANAVRNVGPEVPDPDLKRFPVETVEIVAHGNLVGHTLAELAGSAGHGVRLVAYFRGGVQIPVGPETVIEKGDVVRVTANRLRIQALAKDLGRVVEPSLSTDIITLALGVSLGALVGAITIPVFGLKLSLGSAVGLLLVGIALSILRTRNPALGGPFPEPARQLIEDIGLNVFIAVLGLNAGPGVVKALGGGTVVPILVGVVVAGLLPAFLGFWLGLRRFRMNSAVLLGGVAGARCNSAGLRASQEVSNSIVPAVGYPVAFAISNVVLTLGSYLFALVG